jgi:hypothetical protein
VPPRPRCDAGEGEDVVGHRDVGLPEHRIAERNVDPKGLPVDLACELALGSEAEPVVLDPVVLNLGVVDVRSDFEGHEIAELEAPRLLKLCEHVVGGAHHAEVDVLGGTCPLEA